ncbi:uncharacterized mitochondrial protein AtMg00310-like [Rutidosis leptorrhynchoides]|uniref:uncharacterized mitochondrial protein AtMg00310-like n=1 Tax=Rutidosis leptorrhynchoides TaxID=125765 RepID=UPI003A98E0DF
MILAVLPFDEGKLLVKYLGVLLISSLLHRDCKELVERVMCKLIMSVMTSMQVYWHSVFIISSAIIKEMEALMSGFLWCQGDMKRGKAKIKCSDVCLPKHEGGLGIKRLKEWNTTLMVTHIWRILTNKHSLWIQWIHSYRLKGRNFWDAPLQAGVSVGWRKLIIIRDIVRPHIFSKIGNGMDTSARFNTWCDGGMLADTMKQPNPY